MDTKTAYRLDLPVGDAAFLRKLAKKMGWSIEKYSSVKKARIDKAIEASEKGPLYSTNKLDDLMESLMK